jgi:PAS domain S-box-containing protein
LSARLTAKGDVRYIEGTAADITESREARELLATEKERLAVTLRSIGDGVISTDILGRVVLINRTAEELTGWAGREAIGRPVEDIFCTLDEETLESSESLVKKVLETGGFYAKEENVILVARAGERRYVSSSGAPLRDSESGTIGVVVVFRDVTEKRKMEEDLLRTLKLDSLGTLAGGLAHDFNNILTAVLGNINLAAVLVPPDSKALPRLVEAEKATLRAKELTQQLLTFSKGGTPVRRTASIADLLRESAEFALVGSNVRCEFCIQRDIWPVEVDVAQIGQVIHHLVVNAAEAMPHGGIVRISADNAGRDSGLPAALNPGNYVKITMEDSGMGISVEIAHKIFDPYFTTKEKGTGLGLATSYSIVTKHDGLIEVESVFGTGTTFTVYLPAFEGAAAMENGSKNGPVAGKGRILIMDDEEIVKEIIGEMLAHLGYEVEFAGDGEEAIELYRNALDSRLRFDAVVMDLTIPGAMGGKEAIRKLQEMDPNVKAVVSSGYSNDPVMAHFREFGFSGVITKPFRIQELSEVMNDLFGGDRG